MTAQNLPTDDTVRAFVDLMQGKLDPERIAEGERLIASAQTQYSAVGRMTGKTFYIDVQLELTSGDSRAFKGTGGIWWVGGDLEIGGYVYTTESARLFDQTDSFAMLSDGTRLYFYDKDARLLGHYYGTTKGKPLGPSPAAGAGQWFAV